MPSRSYRVSQRIISKFIRISSFMFSSPFAFIVYDHSRFLSLDDPTEMETYSMSLAIDPSQRRHLLPQAIFATFVHFIFSHLDWYSTQSDLKIFCIPDAIDKNVCLHNFLFSLTARFVFSNWNLSASWHFICGAL